ncbi:MFS transporter [Effusibacillus consociatus]|uniref:MFS transporter n=1 Tax=Effusibacillus consociatus TaxID=1117041 RepID=A0ABV9Q0K3_9BACL
MSIELTTKSLKQDRQELADESRAVFIWSISVWLTVMNTTMFNVALPSVLVDFSLSKAAASWIVSGYSIAFAISTITYSRLSDFIPLRRLINIGITIFGIASVIGFLAGSYEWLLTARLLQAAGAGAVPALGMVMASRYIPVTRRGKAMSMIASAASLGFGLGPIIGGVITEYLGWSYLFVVTGLILLLLPFYQNLFPAEKAQKGRFDAVGAILTAVGVTSLLLFLSTFYYSLLIFGFAVLWSLRKHIQRMERPFIQPELLRNRPYVMLLIIGFSAFFTHFSLLFLMPIMLQELFGKDPSIIGMIIFPGAILSAAAAQWIGRLIDRFGNKQIIRSGHCLLGFSTVVFAVLSGFSPYVTLFGYIFTSVGFSALTSSLANEISRILPEKQIGAGMGMVQLIQFFGGAFGVAIVAFLMLWLKGVSPEAVYRNLYSGLTGLLVVSFVIFALYLRKRT